jgi:hypothetical protein
MNYLSYIDKDGKKRRKKIHIINNRKMIKTGKDKYVYVKVFLKMNGGGLSMSRPSMRVAPEELVLERGSYGIQSIANYRQYIPLIIGTYNDLYRYRNNLYRQNGYINFDITNFDISKFEFLYGILIRNTSIYKFFKSFFYGFILKINSLPQITEPQTYEHSNELMKLIYVYKKKLLKKNKYHNISFIGERNEDLDELSINGELIEHFLTKTVILKDDYLILELCLIIIFIHFKTYNIFASFKISNRLNRDTYLLDDTNPDNLPNIYDNIISMLFYLYENQINMHSSDVIIQNKLLSSVFTDLYIASIIIQKYGSDAHKELFAKIIKKAYYDLYRDRRFSLSDIANTSNPMFALLEKVTIPPEL